MGGKSRKSGGVSKKLVSRLKEMVEKEQGKANESEKGPIPFYGLGIGESESRNETDSE